MKILEDEDLGRSLVNPCLQKSTSLRKELYYLEALDEGSNFKSWRFGRRCLNDPLNLERESLSRELMERERGFNFGEDEVKEEREGKFQFLIWCSKRANSGKQDGWLRSKGENWPVARFWNPLGRNAESARAVGSRELTFENHKIQPEGLLGLEKNLRMVYFSNPKSSEIKA